jgi:mannose/fructose/N-acetylgalactosamine-specific phosphotransferase system component IIC
MSDSKQNEPQVNGGLILALSILGLLLCGPLTIVSWIMANEALRCLWNYPHSGQRGLVRAGQIISVVGMLLWILVVGVKMGARNQGSQRANRSYGASLR